MTIDTIRVRPDSPTTGTELPPGVVDVTDLAAARVRALAGDGRDVHLERRGARTYLVPAA